MKWLPHAAGSLGGRELRTARGWMHTARGWMRTARGVEMSDMLAGRRDRLGRCGGTR